MHHELFFALLGHAGDVVEQRSDGFFVRSDISFLSPPERAMIDRLLHLGHAFSILDRFVSTASTSATPSLYVRGLAHGIETILHEYMDAVIHLEAKILATCVVFPIPQMMYELDEFVELLPHLQKLIVRIQPTALATDNASATIEKGASLLKVLHEAARSGFPRVRTRMQQLQRACHTIWYKQILSWMAYGEIVDPYDEFFVRTLPTNNDATQDTRQKGRQSIESQIWQTRFTLEMANVPSYLPVRTAESIFFVGKCVQILSVSKGFSAQEAHRLVQTFAKVQSAPEFNAAIFERVVEDIRGWIAGRLYQEIVVKADFIEQLKLLKNMFLLGRGELFQSLLEQTRSHLMAFKPTLKSEEELQFGVWSQILREYQIDENPMIKHFRLELPLQTFRFPPFPGAHGLVLANAKCSEKAMEVKTTAASLGRAWWPHRQVEQLPFTSNIGVELSMSSPAGWQGDRVALLLTRDDQYAATEVVETNGGLVLNGGGVSIEVCMQPISGDAQHIAVAARALQRRNGQPDKAQTSEAQAVPVSGGKVTVHVQYARVEDRDATGKVVSPRQVVVIANGVKILDAPFDLSVLLGRGSLSNEHYVGLCFTSGLRVTEWRLDKYPPRAYIQPGQLLGATHESLSARDLWNYLAMRCELQWPMHLLVSKSLLRSYNQLFQFLFRLKRLVHALECTWKHRVLRSSKDKNEQTLRAAVALRGRMSFVVRTIQQYFQVFVVESSFHKCLEEIEAAHDFDRVQRLHDQFVAHLAGRFYLQTQAVQSSIEQLLRCCWDFAEYVGYQEGATNGQGSLLAERVADLEKQFNDKFGLAFRTLRNPSMRDLLLLLDYNEFFSQSAGASAAMAGSAVSMEFNSSH